MLHRCLAHLLQLTAPRIRAHLLLLFSCDLRVVLQVRVNGLCKTGHVTGFAKDPLQPARKVNSFARKLYQYVPVIKDEIMQVVKEDKEGTSNMTGC